MSHPVPQRLVIDRGLDIRCAGEPLTVIDGEKRIRTVALVGDDYPGLKPSFAVHPGERVRQGDTLFVDRRDPRLRFTAPVAGRVTAIQRGERRSFRWIAIEREGDEAVTFPSFDPEEIPSLDRERVVGLLLESGLWTALRSRPFEVIPSPDTVPSALFVTATDTSPLAVDPAVVAGPVPDLLRAGLAALRRLLDGPLYLCHSPRFPGLQVDGVTPVCVSGPHPAGLAGTHIHFLAPVGRDRTVWHVPVREVIAIGSLFLLGRIDPERVISLGGPGVIRPRLLKVPVGGSLAELVEGELRDGTYRVIGGSILHGRRMEEVPFLGRLTTQVSVLPERRRRDFLGWLRGVVGRYPARIPRTTARHGSLRAIVPIGVYDDVMPLEVETVWLLRSLLADDLEGALELGALQLAEEDLSLLTYVCPSKIDYGAFLRKMLDRIAREGV